LSIKGIEKVHHFQQTWPFSGCASWCANHKVLISIYYLEIKFKTLNHVWLC
jgi:hypothetical protein